jgi:tRNA (adenine57-N1/adenine58-N1)-methyltransferase
MHLGSIEEGFRQTGVDALFLDVREPWHYLAAVRGALKTGGFFAGLLPTTNQVCDLIAGLEATSFGDVAVEELLLRSYKAAPDRLRPDDMMIGHTGYLVFARSLPAEADAARWQSRDRLRYRARRQMQDDIAAEAERRSQASEGDTGRKYPRLPLPD